MIASIITALYLLGYMSASSASTFLLITGALLIIAEITTLTTFGILGFNGGLALAVGYMMSTGTDTLFGLSVDWPFFFGIAFVEVLMLGACVFVVLYLRGKKITTGIESMIGESAEVIEWSGNKGRVRVQGEDWKAVSDTPIKTDDTVIVQKIKNLTLIVTKA